MWACCPGVVLSLVTPDPCVILASVLFSCQFGFLVHIGGSRLGGDLFGSVALIGSCSPRCARGWQSPACYLSAPSTCIVRLLVSGVSIGLFALNRACSLFKVWVFALFFFLRPLLFRFLTGFRGFTEPVLEVPVGGLVFPLAFLASRLVILKG